MSHSRNKVSLGAVLQQAGLVSAEQIKQALKHQRQSSNSLKISEVLAIQGRINSETANFFAENWSRLLLEKPKQPIGQYLKQAALLSEQQIQILLNEQKQTKKKFGELAIAKSWLKQTTVNFFLWHLMPESFTDSEIKNFKKEMSLTINANNPKMPQKNDSAISLTKPQSESTEQLEYSQKVHEGFLKIKRKLLKIEGQNNYSEKILDRVLHWTGGQSFLTQKLFILLAENLNTTNDQQEEEQVDDLVQTKIINDWENNKLGLHLKTIKERLLNNRQCQTAQLLLLYQKILAETVLVNQSSELQELLNMGLVVRQQSRLIVSNRIYKSVFNLSWVTKKLNPAEQSNSLAQIVPVSTQTSSVMLNKSHTEPKNGWFKFKNILLLLTLIGLLTIFFNNIAKRMRVRVAFHKANELLKQKSFTEAIVKYNQLLNIDSNYFQAWTNRGYALAGLQKYEEMGESCSTATIINPKAVYAWNCRGEALHNLQKYPQAIASFERAISLNKTDPIFLINKSESLRALGRNEASITAIEKAIQVLEQIEASEGRESIKGEFAVALTFLGNGYRQREQYQDAVAAYQRAITYSADYFSAHIGKGIALVKAGRFQEAQREFEDMVKNPQLTEAQQSQTWFHLGQALCKSDQYPRGVAAFEQAIELKPDYKIAEEAKKQCS